MTKNVSPNPVARPLASFNAIKSPLCMTKDTLVPVTCLPVHRLESRCAPRPDRMRAMENRLQLRESALSVTTFSMVKAISPVFMSKDHDSREGKNKRGGGRVKTVKKKKKRRISSMKHMVTLKHLALSARRSVLQYATFKSVSHELVISYICPSTPYTF